jgi:non-ribosomal peptide synthetase component E (peptide arylation enzyme)
MIPDRFRMLDGLPMTPTGKIDHGALVADSLRQTS